MKRPTLDGTSPRVLARLAGSVALAVLVSGSLSGGVVSRLLVRDDAAATSANILASELLFRLGIVGGLVMMVAYLVYALLLYRLLRPVDRTHAMMMLGFVVVSVPIYMLNQVHLAAALHLAPDQRYEQVALFLELHRLGTLISAIFFGLWLFPLGLLVFRSRFLPRAIGVLLMVGSAGYLVLFVQAFFFPGSERTLWSNPLLVVTHLSELALMLWLLIRGVDVDQWQDRAVEAGLA